MNRSVLITTCLWIPFSSTLCFGESHPTTPPPHPRRNLFQPVETAPTPRPLTAIPPLQRYPITALTLTAIITNTAGERFASVENPEGIGYKVARGTIIGDAGARVVEISDRGIVVEESGPDGVRNREILLRVEG
jgi:Tfp pilus assembly protein PilP